MRKKPVVILSQSLETLAKLLRDNLFKTPSQALFKEKLIFLPNLHLKNTLLTSFFKEEELNVIMGFDFMELGEGVQKLFKLCTKKTLLFLPLNLLALQLEAYLEMPGLAPKLAIEFLRYGKFGGFFLKNWSSHWQKEIWDQVFSTWNYPYELLEVPLKKPAESLEVHLFNFPFLPRLYHLFFDRLSKYVPVTYYQFSPCKEFWSDTVTDFEKMRLLEKDQQLSFYLDQGHPVLSNFGKMGRETFRTFEEEDFTLEEHYEEIPLTSSLSRLQEGILSFKKSSPEKDDSFLLLPASSKLREVEILYSKLISSNVQPSEIQVFAPDISKYAPLIEMVFGGDDSPYEFSIFDLPQNPFLQTFFDLLSLDRFKPAALFKLFSSPFFSSLDEKEVKELRSWIEQTGVKWGVDASHRKKLLPGFIDETESGTWEEAFHALLKNLIFAPEKPTDWDLPYLDFSVAELLGKVMHLIRSLRKDLEFTLSAELFGSEWADHLLILCSRYLSTEEDQFAPFQEKILLLKELKGRFTFGSIKRYLASGLKEKSGAHLTRNLESITFRSLRPGMVSSSKIIALLGINEGDYPRSYVPSSLNLLGRESDYCPSPSDEDRYLFLELLMNAQKEFWTFYQNISDEDGKECPPSLLIQELDPKVEIHPPFPFHHHYFSKARVYPLHHYKTAEVFYSVKENIPFIPEFLYKKPLREPYLPGPITLQDLSQFAKHPIRFYFNRILNLYLHFDDQTDEEFFLSPLQKHKLMQEEKGLFQARDRGQLPLGRFKEVAERNIKKEWEGIILFETKPYKLKNMEGTLEIAQEGFPYMGTAKLHDLIKVYPLYIALSVENPVPLLPLKEGEPLTLKSDPKKALEDYLHYYKIACSAPSPLHPYFASSILEKDAEALGSRIRNTSIDAYTHALFKDPDSYDPEVIFETWAPLLRRTFAPLLEMIS